MKRIGTGFRVRYRVHAVRGSEFYRRRVLRHHGSRRIPFAGRAHTAIGERVAALFAVVLCPAIYEIIGGIGALIGAWIYNLVSGWMGGLELEID